MSTSADIAIVGMACRFPGASSIREFWDNLTTGQESIRRFERSELIAAGEPASRIDRPDYVAASPVLRDVKGFDAAFFDYSPREARIMDPQHRLFLEVGWEAFEDAAYCPEQFDGDVGIFAGSGGVVSSYLVDQLTRGSEILGPTGSLSHLGNDKDFLSTRLSYQFDARGPSVNVQTACSTSMVAVHLACQSLLLGECAMALAGASTVRTPQIRGYLAVPGDILSADGRCRPFDAKASGTVFGSGVGAVVLKRLDRALAARDHIYAIIKGTAINNDGGMKISYTASSVSGQVKAMTDALRRSGVQARSIGYVECHGTGTVLGDPIEVDALTKAFRKETQDVGFCAIGSVKANIGHLEQSAGIAALIKTALAIRHAVLPPSIHFDTPNPKIRFSSSPFRVHTSVQPWPGPRFAAINSLGLGGTNAFAILGEAPEVPPAAAQGLAEDAVLCLSCKSEEALSELAERYANALARGDLDAQDVCATAAIGRRQFPFRKAYVGGDRAELLQALRAAPPLNDEKLRIARKKPKAPAFLFSGQGSQYPGMARYLYERNARFRSYLDEAAALLDSMLDRRLYEVMFGSDLESIDQTIYTQPALFAVEVSLARLLQHYGVTPGILLGHSVGELAAATFAGVFTLEEGLSIVVPRARLMQSVSKAGSMAALFVPADRAAGILAPLSPDEIGIAAYNGPTNTVISGTSSAVERALARCMEEGIEFRKLPVSHAFHSPLMEPILGEMAHLAHGIPPRAPSIPLISNVTGLPFDGPIPPAYWARHVRESVRFADGLAVIEASGAASLIEIGPGKALLGLARSGWRGEEVRRIPLLDEKSDKPQLVAEALGALYETGYTLDWKAVLGERPFRRVSLPTYPFQHKDYWLDEDVNAVHPLLGEMPGRTSSSFEFHTKLSLERLPYLADHIIHGACVLPITAALEAVLSVGRRMTGQVHVERALYQHGIVVPNDGNVDIKVVVRQATDGEWHVSLQSPADEGVATTYFSAICKSGNGSAPEQLQIDTLRARLGPSTSADTFYPNIAKIGFGYGPAFRGVREIWMRDGEALARIDAGDGHHSSTNAAAYVLHPAVLDACLHTYIAALPHLDWRNIEQTSSRSLLPLSVESFEIHMSAAQAGWAHVRLRDHTSTTALVDINFYSDAGTLCASLRGLALKELGLENIVAPRFAANLYEVNWERSIAPPAAHHEGTWLVFADRGGVADSLTSRLEAHGANVVSIPRGNLSMDAALRNVVDQQPGPWRGVVYLWGLNESDSPGLSDPPGVFQRDTLSPALELCQALGEVSLEGNSPQLWLVTRNSQSALDTDTCRNPLQATLWGLGRTFAQEYPRLWGGLIDLDDRCDMERDAACLTAELAAPDKENQVCYRGGTRYVARLSRIRERPPVRPLQISSTASYLITGGLGALGLETAAWLVESGARHLILVGRQAPTVDPVGLVRKAMELDARVSFERADITQRDEVDALFSRIRVRYPRLSGIVHCAGQLDDATLTRMSREQFDRVLAPKVAGGWWLHHASRDMSLDFMVFYSSILGVTGSAGQSNYTTANAFLDALGHQRRAQGLPTAVMNWGPWRVGGMATGAGEKGEIIWKRRGTRYLSVEAAFAALEYTLTRELGHGVVTDTDWKRFLEQLPSITGFYRHITPPSSLETGLDAEAQAFKKRFAEASGPESSEALAIQVVEQQVMRVLGLDTAPSRQATLESLGLDSLIAVELGNRISAITGKQAQITRMLQGGTIADVAAELSQAGVQQPAAKASTRSGARKSTGWFVSQNEVKQPRVRLFCFPFAGGNPSAFSAWAKDLHSDIELYAVHYPGRGTRAAEPLAHDVAKLADSVAEAMQEKLDLPFAMFGHSLGGLVMYECMLRLARRRHVYPAIIFPSAVVAPHLYRIDKYHERSDEDLADLLRELDASNSRAILDNPATRSVALDVVRADLRAAAYYPQVFAGATSVPVPIAAFGANADPFAPVQGIGEWARYSPTFSLRIFEGGHFFHELHRLELVRCVADSTLDAVRSGSSRTSHVA